MVPIPKPGQLILRFITSGGSDVIFVTNTPLHHYTSVLWLACTGQPVNWYWETVKNDAPLFDQRDGLEPEEWL